jgi:hypothetical protein
MSRLPIEKREIRLAMVGMVEGNGHPYSWSAIFNGYEPQEMAKCPYPVIPAYLGKQPPDTLRIPHVSVTHIWADRPSDAESVARASLIPNILKSPEDAIGLVDAVIIPTDIGHEHVHRVRPFIEAGLPVFVDKPLVDSEPDLEVFMKWAAEGKPILSSSCMRYAKEYLPYRESELGLGSLRLVTMTTPKSWERYGIHALEGFYPILGPGFISARNIGSEDRNIVRLRHKSGIDVIVAAINDLYGAFGVLSLYGTEGHKQAVFGDTYYAFRKQLESFVYFLRTGEPPFPFSETVELMKMLIAGRRSRIEDAREVLLEELCCSSSESV